MEKLDLTPTEERLYETFLDGCCHSQKQLMNCLDDNLSSVGALRTALFRLKKKIISHHRHIIRKVIDGENHYQLVRVISVGE